MANAFDRSRQDQEDAGAMVAEDAAESVTRLLLDAQQQGDDTWDRIYALIYQDLHRIARSQIRQQLHPGLSPTSLISETWLRLARSQVAATCRPHLISLIARAMRFVLLDEARRVLANKRGSGRMDETLSQAERSLANDPRLEEMLVLDKALDNLAGLDPRLAKVVELRYYGGMEEAEIAQILGVTTRTVRRDWRKARAFLYKHLQ